MLLILANAAIVSLSLYRLQRTSGYALVAQTGQQPRLPASGLLFSIRLTSIGVIITLLADIAVLLYLGFDRDLWVFMLLVWNGIQLASWLGNYMLLTAETRRFKTYSSMTRSYWLVSSLLECVVISEWIATMTSDQTNPLHPQSQNLFASVILRALLTWATLFADVVFGWFFKRPAAPVADLENSADAPSQARHQPTGDTGLTKKLKRLAPFLWPERQVGLQLLILATFAVLLFGRVVNPFVPYQYKRVVDMLTSTQNTSPGLPIGPISLLIGARLLQSSLLSNLQSFLWLPIGQYTTRNISVRMLRHLHSLSLRFHVMRKTGEVLRVLDRGTSSIVSILQMLLFTLGPVIVDIIIAVGVISVAFDVYFGLIVFCTMACYVAVTIIITEWRTKFRRQMIELDNKTNQYGIDSLLNFETVKYYNAEDFEVSRYDQAMRKSNVADFKSSSSMQLLNVTQGLVFSAGLFIACLLCSWRVVYDNWTSGDFVMLFTYMVQLYGPLNWFGTVYRVIQQNFVDLEKMVALFAEEPDVQDLPFAQELQLKGGAVEFNNVQFAYDTRQPALKSVSFSIPPGATVALVGESGSGKSTILRLLFRFYDVTGGEILVDGQNIRNVKQFSLRRHIGVDTVLFNDSIRYNIRYARPDATDQEVEAAAAAAQIHERIMSFPDQYDTVVGERGLRLSGGEKQRVAIARTILKNPSIILLDEATSALDTTTERHIQAALQRLCQGRTTLVVAHRLSTIAHADAIMVLDDGEVVESGTHVELLEKHGAYHQLWMKQLEHPVTEQEPIA
ncbi:ATP-binding cassette-type vacuolar membrane transporter Hmt1 [Sorochytrium milnesiophthora]